MNYLEHFNNQARADLHLIAHTREGCKCKGDGLRGAPSEAAQEKAAASTSQSSKRQKTSAAASNSVKILKPKRGSKARGDEPMQPPSYCKSFYLTELFLVSGSKYFCTLLETAVGGLETEMSTVGKPRTITILHDYIEEGEMEAVELVLKSFYDKGEPPLDTLPSEIDAKVPLLLQALMVAERYQADRCKDEIIEALSSTPLSDLSYQAVKNSVQLPGYLEEFPSLSGFKTSVSYFLAQRFGNLPLVIKTAALRLESLELPFHAFLALIKSDDLKVHSENDVVYLLDKWIETNEPSYDQRDALIKEIRVVNLGPAYFHSILPNLKWFKDSSLYTQIHWITLSREGDLSTEEFRKVKRQAPDLPPSWLSAPRKAPGYTPPASTAFTWVVKEDQLKKLCDRETVHSEPVYHNGHWIKGSMRICQKKGSNLYSLWVGLITSEISYHPCVSAVRLRLTTSIEKEGIEPKKWTDTWFLANDSFWGWRDFLNRQRPTIQRVVAPYRKLTIKYEISKVDEAKK